MFSKKIRTPEPDRRPPPLPRLATSSIESVVITEAAVRRHLKGVNVRKASGPDGVNPHLLKHCADKVTTPLVFIFRQCLVTRVWPSQWKEARITPVHKKKGKSNPSNYGPISVPSVVSKICERIIGEQVTLRLPPPLNQAVLVQEMPLHLRHSPSSFQVLARRSGCWPPLTGDCPGYCGGLRHCVTSGASCKAGAAGYHR